MKRIDKYEILGPLGQGGVGTVYKGHDTLIDRDVAIKVLHEKALQDETTKKRFYREAQSAGRLSHENITIIFELGEDNGKPYIVMEYLEGDDLRSLLKAGVTLSLADKLSIASQICRGLHYAHERGVIHRDIKPGNVRVLPSGRVKIMDFGLARSPGCWRHRRSAATAHRPTRYARRKTSFAAPRRPAGWPLPPEHARPCRRLPRKGAL